MRSSISLPIIKRMTCESSPTSLCAECHRAPSQEAEHAINRIRAAYDSDERDWYLAFSGGKDSTALLCLLVEALKRSTRPTKPVTILFCDTGVEIPTMATLVHRTLRRLRAEAATHALPIHTRCARPALGDSYFVKVIGRGYPPPTNKFRWCTDRLRINPVQRILKSSRVQDATVLVGVRRGESATRDRTLQKHRTKSTEYRLSQSGRKDISLFAPLLDLGVEDVWAVIHSPLAPRSIDAKTLADLYREAGSECSMLKTEHGTPCGAGRFGCWTCTVVRKDRAVTNLIAEGAHDLVPLLEFRNWLVAVRDRPEYRCRYRRNGTPGPGPFTLGARREILAMLRRAEARTHWRLIGQQELAEIRRLWKMDERDARYRE